MRTKTIPPKPRDSVGELASEGERKKKVGRKGKRPGAPPKYERNGTPKTLGDLLADLERERQISAALREVGVAVGNVLDLDQLLELILDKITEALEADRATLYLLNENKQELVSRIVQGEEVRSIRLKVGRGIAGYVAETGELVHVSDAYKDDRFNPDWDMLSGYRTRQILAAPMKNHMGRIIGVVQVLNKKHGDFSALDRELLTALSTQAAISIDNSRLFLSVTQKNMQLLDIKEQLEHRVRDLKLLFDLESAMGRAASLDDLYSAVLTEAMRACEARWGAVALREREGSIALYIVDERHKKPRRMPLEEGQGILGWVLLHNQTVMTTEAGTDARRDPELDERLGLEATSALIVPLEGEGEQALGAIGLYNKKVEPRAREGRPAESGFSEEDKGLLKLVAANASTAVRLQLSREAREREERLSTIGRLLSSVIHDLKTPLTVISGYVQLMQEETQAKKRQAFAEQILKQFDHIGAMQREVLEFARGEKSVLIRKVYLARFFGDVEAQLRMDLEKRSVKLVIDLEDKGTARFDEGKVLRVIHNLARNAAEAMGEPGGTFTVRVSREKEGGGEAVVLSFSDTGPGIPKEIEARLFQSFVTSGKKGGTGLGLAIVKKIAEEHGGSISVESTSKGCTFRLRLPQ